MALRGASAPAFATCATFSEYENAILAGGTKAALLLRVAYPRPTDCTVVLGGTLGTGQPSDAFLPSLLAIPPPPGSPAPAAYLVSLGAYWIEWIVGGAVQSTIVDLGANALSLPAVDQVTVKFISFGPFTSGQRFTAQVLPIGSAGAVSTCSRVPVIVTAPNPVFLARRNQWARRWKVTASDGQLASAVPISFGSIVVSVLDDPAGLLTAEQINFSDAKPPARSGMPAAGQGWVEVAGGATGYQIHNTATLGMGPATVKLVEQIQVG